MAKQLETPIDPREAELVDNMIMDVMEYIHGKGSNEIVKALENSTDTAATMSAIAYKVVKGVADKRVKSAQVEMDMDMMMGVATEAIDMVTEVAEAAKQITTGANVTQLKEDTLLRMVALHGEQLEGEKGFSAEMKQAAATDLRDYMSDGGTQKAFDYVNTRAKAEGLNPQDMMRAGNEAALGKKNPIAESVTEALKPKEPGLMDGAPMGSDQGPPPDRPPEEPGLMDQGTVPPPNMPNPLPTGQGIVENPNVPPTTRPTVPEELAAPERRY
jgi:hypothetical protein